MEFADGRSEGKVVVSEGMDVKTDVVSGLEVGVSFERDGVSAGVSAGGAGSDGMGGDGISGSKGTGFKGNDGDEGIAG